MAQYQQFILACRNGPRQADSTDCLLVEVRLSQQVKQAVRLSINELQVRVDDCQEEAPFEVSLVWEVSRGSAWPWHDHLNLGKREASLLEVCAVLAQDYLPLVFVLLIGVEKRVGDDGVVLLASRLLAFGLEAWA